MNNISKFRKSTGMTQAQFAEHLGWGQSRIANYEKNNRTPSLKNSRQIVTAFNQLGCKVTLDDVFPTDN